MSTHVLTIHLVIQVPDGDEDTHAATVEAFEAAADNLLEAGAIQKLIADAAGDFDDVDEGASITEASCVMDEFEPTDGDEDEDE